MIPPPPQRCGHGSVGKGSADHDLAIWTDSHIKRLHTNSLWVKQHETVPGSCGRGGPLYASKWIRSLFSENDVRPIPHQHLSEHGGAHQGERAEHLCIERNQVPGCTLHSQEAYEPAGRSQRAERLPSPQRDQGAICSALGEHPQDPRERGAGPGALTPVVRTGSHTPPLENGPSPSHIPAVSVFTAELLAISIALQHVSAIPSLPSPLLSAATPRRRWQPSSPTL